MHYYVSKNPNLIQNLVQNIQYSTVQYFYNYFMNKWNEKLCMMYDDGDADV